MFGSYWLALIFQTSHVISEVSCLKFVVGGASWFRASALTLAGGMAQA